MRNTSTVHRLLRSALLVVLSIGAFPAVAQAARGPDIAPGRYEGSIDIGGGAVAPIALRLLEGGGGLVDLPGQDIYGYPLTRIVVEGDRLAFILGEEGDEGGALRFDASSVAGEGPLRLEGGLSQGTGGANNAGGPPAGVLSLVLADPDISAGLPRAVAVPGGKLGGSLLMPAGPGPWPLAVIVAGAGTTDRDGNNYSVPGRNDGLKALALALAGRGVASYRYDKRGAGESYTLGRTEAESRFSDLVDDAVAVLESFSGDRRFSRVVLVGHTEGGLVAAAAAATAVAAIPAAAAGPELSGLALLCVTGKTSVETVEEGLSSVPEELKPEAQAIMEALKAGTGYANPSDYFSDFFRPSFQPWLASWFSLDIRAIVSSLGMPVVMAQGDRDFQLSLADFLLLAKARPDAPALVVPLMNHVLKAVPPELDENYRAFSDPSFELAPGLAELVAALALGEPFPEGLPRVDGGVVPTGADAAVEAGASP